MAGKNAGNTPFPNEFINPSVAAISTLTAYPLATLRKDLESSEWLSYKYAWRTFEEVWGYNYTVSTLNGTDGGKRRLWQFQSSNEKKNYINGQQAHVAVYSNAPATQFSDITLQ
jgi:hypothetical protein